MFCQPGLDFSQALWTQAIDGGYLIKCQGSQLSYCVNARAFEVIMASLRQAKYLYALIDQNVLRGAHRFLPPYKFRVMPPWFPPY